MSAQIQYNHKSNIPKGRRKSNIIPWLNTARKWKSNRDEIISRFEETYSTYTVDSTADPINILCIDGGGMKGMFSFLYAAMSTMFLTTDSHLKWKRICSSCYLRSTSWEVWNGWYGHSQQVWSYCRDLSWRCNSLTAEPHEKFVSV